MQFKYSLLELVEGYIKDFQVYPVSFKDSIAWNNREEWMKKMEEWAQEDSKHVFRLWPASSKV